MRKLYHHTICPFSRQAKIYLSEAKVDFVEIKEDFWLRKRDFKQINPAGTLPVIEEASGITICGIYPVTEYLSEKYPNFILMPEDFGLRVEIRRIIDWFNTKFYHEVTKILIDQKIIKLIASGSYPNTEHLRIAKFNLNKHFEYLTSLLDDTNFFASEYFNCADVAAAAHISIVDYLGEIYWDEWQTIKNWYSVAKSRPSLRAILHEKIYAIAPPSYYTKLDF